MNISLDTYANAYYTLILVLSFSMILFSIILCKYFLCGWICTNLEKKMTDGHVCKNSPWYRNSSSQFEFVMKI